MTFGVNDYPWPTANCAALNPFCGYTFRQCVDFAAWRIRHDMGLPCYHWGSGGAWAANAARTGIPVDRSPRVHDVVCYPPGVQGASGVGHVAVVLAVGNGSVLVEDYNYGYPSCNYHQHVTGTAGAYFIHLVGASPTPPPPGDPMWMNRRVALVGNTTNGYELDGWGGLHPIGSMPPAAGAPYWPGLNIARDVVLAPDGSGGFVLDGAGGIHPFAALGEAPPPASGYAYWSGATDVAAELLVTAWRPVPAGYTIDVLGGMHPFGGAPALIGGAYFPKGDTP